MAIGSPFSSYEKPDVYTQTRNDAPVATISGAIKFPIFIGVGDEFVQVENEEIVRGSSAIADNPVTKEDVSSQLDGIVNYFYVDNFPIVSGDGSGTTTNNPINVQVFVNKNPAAVAIVEGSTGKITLQNIPREDDVVQISYFYKNTDTLITNDVSDQTDGTNKAFKVAYSPIVDGTNGGITTTDPNRVSAKVNGVDVTVSEVDGANGVITLATAPAATDEVLVTYYYNLYRNTSDPLQFPNVLEMDLVGLVPDKADFTETVDFIVKNDAIHWGTTFIIEAGAITPNSEAFDDTQLTSTLIDNRFYLREAIGDSDGINKVFSLEDTPVDGTGTDIPTEDPSKIQVYVGTDIQTAIASGLVVVLDIDASTNEITLKTAPAVGEKVYVTQYRNFIIDDSYTFECTTTGAGGVGEYKITSTKNGEIATIKEGTHVVSDAADFATEGITWPNGVSDLTTTPGTSISEVVTLTFTSAYDYTVSSDQGALGSSGFGHLEQTYYDPKTGIRFTILEGTTVTYAPGDTLEFVVAKGGNFLSGPLFYNAIPGLKTRVTNQLDVTVGDSAIVTTYNKAGNEPNVGDFYYATYKYEKTDYDPIVVTKWRDVEPYSGKLSLSNKLTLAAYLAFQNGAIKIGLKQIKKAPGQQDATVVDYKAAIDEMKKELRGHGYPYLVQPITTNGEVLDYLKFHNELLSSIRYKAERVSVYGSAAGTDFEDAIEFAQGIKSDRMIGIYPDTAIISLNDEYGNEFESSVDGSFIAAALSGLIVNPIYDEATPLTTKKLVGFKRLGRLLDTVEMNTVASAGLTVIEENLPSLEIRHFLTTNPDNVLTQEPNIVFIKDKVQKATRDNLKEFIGQKFLDKLIQDVEEKLSSMFNSFIGAEIVAEYTGIEATRSESDPRILNVIGYYRPIFGLLWIKTTYNIRTTL